jgi:uncharacterized protein
MNFHCPICGRPTDSKSNADFPFCSERCRLLDLGNWSAEKYKISEPIFDEGEESDEVNPAAQKSASTPVRKHTEGESDD